MTPDAGYDVRATVGEVEFARMMERYRAESVAAVAGLPGRAGLPYDDSGEVLDVWGTGARPRPVFVFLHGGYWRMLSRHDSAFMARALAGHGIATVVPDYTLAPRVSLEEIVRQVRTAVAWIHRHGPGHGLDPARIVVGGSSAGGHLAAMTAVGGWQEPLGLPSSAVRAVLPVSGLFDLRPLVRTYVNEWLGLDEARAAALSPLLRPVEPGCPAHVVVAEHDGAGFLEQAASFHARWPSELLTVPGRHHYDVILDLADTDSALTRALLNLF
ncbi:alpha/beta hydrolase [Streptosporangium saharense]|uniref:alpha/beta hydrolase n=1 Tax=Streptosporangium saharense TaxID=1706840 RepID=UPI00368CE431